MFAIGTKRILRSLNDLRPNRDTMDVHSLWGTAMRRRRFLSLVGSVAAWPLVTHTQTAIPVIGYLSARSASAERPLREPFLKSLEEAGFVVGRNIAIE